MSLLLWMTIKMEKLILSAYTIKENTVPGTIPYRVYRKRAKSRGLLINIDIMEIRLFVRKQL